MLNDVETILFEIISKEWQKEKLSGTNTDVPEEDGGKLQLWDAWTVRFKKAFSIIELNGSCSLSQSLTKMSSDYDLYQDRLHLNSDVNALSDFYKSGTSSGSVRPIRIWR
jgi:hypothetical protein